MARTKTPALKPEDDKMVDNSQGRALPETQASGEVEEAVSDLPPANPLGEPVKPVEAYSDGGDAEVTAGTNKPAETIVEHPLSPTDTNPNPHGQRSQLDVMDVVVDKDTKVASRRAVGDAEENTVTITGLADNPVHLGDGRILAKGESAKVSKDAAKTLRDNGQAK
ncbi:MAG: hypothetical protein ACOYBT_09955 [Polynucleobacter sp.]